MVQRFAGVLFRSVLYGGFLMKLGNWLWYLLAGGVIYFFLPAGVRVWFLLVVLLGALSRPGVLDRLKSTLAGAK